MIAVDKVFILTFPGDAEKKKQLFEERLKSIPLPEQIVTEICEVPEQEALNAALSGHGLRLPEGYMPGNAMPGEWEEMSMAVGHWNVWQKAAQEKHRSVLILEERFLPSANHYQILNTDVSWEMLYLGRHSRGSDIPFETGGLMTPGYSDGSFAYMINEAGINKLLQSGYDRNVIPVGEFLTAMHGTHPNREISSLFSSRITAVAPMKNFIEVDKAWPLDNGYKPLHPQLFDAFGKAEKQWVKRYLNPQLANKEFDLICDEPIDNVYSFPLFTPLFCKELIEEAEHYGEWTSYRGPNTPPTDIMLTSLGFNDIYTHMLKKYLYPLFYHKYQLHGEGWKKLNSQNYIVRYLSELQGHLGLHNDGSYLSMVVALNTDFEGGGTIFPKFKKLIKHDQPGYAAIHPGLLGYIHGARPVTKGTRYILASFFFSGPKHPFAEGTF